VSGASALATDRNSRSSKGRPQVTAQQARARESPEGAADLWGSKLSRRSCSCMRLFHANFIFKSRARNSKSIVLQKADARLDDLSHLFLYFFPL
jgi:hypothetical protein